MEKELKAFGMTFLTVIVSLIVYNLFFKAFLPTGIRNAVGLS